MINHLRTLLLNAEGSNNPGPTYPGEQFVPPDYRARSLPPWLQNVHTLLFGVNPDRASKNYRLQEFLTCVHAAGLGGFVAALDSRVTYWPFNTSLLEKILLGATAVKLAGAAGQELSFVGSRTASENVHRIYFRWRLDVISGAVVRVRTYNDALQAEATYDLAYTLTAGLSSAVTLPGSLLQVKFNAGVGGSWLVEAVAAPARGLAGLAADLDRALDDSLASQLFPPTSAEPYLTFRNLWFNSDQLPLRLAGVVLAFGYRVHELAG